MFNLTDPNSSIWEFPQFIIQHHCTRKEIQKYPKWPVR